MATTQSTDSNLGQTVMMPVGGQAGAVLPPSAEKKSPKPVAIVEGSQPDFTHETNNILRDRLRQASLLLFLGYTAFLIKALVLSRDHYTTADWICLGLLILTSVNMGIIAQRLCAGCSHVARHLRAAEAVIFGSSALLFLAIGYATLLRTAESGYLTNILPPWLLLIFTYALFIPNSWQRAAKAIIPLALCPLAVILVAWGTSPKVAALIENTTDFHHIFLETVMGMTFASTLAIGGVRIIRQLRTEAFHAQQLGQYRLKRPLGKGGMGEVYLAEHLMLKRPCAIKLIRPEKAGDPSTLARFEQEVQSTAKLTHWNTVEIYDFGQTGDGTFYYVMEYLPGMSLDQIVEMHGPLEPSRVLHLLTQTCDALHEAHSHCLVHRDIKPANIFAAKRGGTYDVAKLLDFGLVRSLQPEADLHLTQDSVVTGSPLYMSPEQARGDEVDHRSDIYALGCTAYFLLTGRTPFNETSAIKLLLAHAQQTPEPPSSFNPNVPADLEAVILKCLEKSPEKRYADVMELRDALTNCRDYGRWTRQSALDWWQGHGCPRKRELDSCISQGIDLHDAPVETTESCTETELAKV